ncbi:MAG TPA: hypothetical protein VNK05_19490 [Chloroflexota bacterium]|jgi:hypothetical protein|nr:hypothetical protein [Chloroflexota bacterium]
MDWLKRLFGIGRLTGEPQDQTAGRVLAPASVQRTQLGLKDVDLPRGVVTLRTGEVRCFLQVTGLSVHHRSAADARAWLQGYARALSTLPGNAVLLVRSRSGGLEAHIARQRVQTAALAKASPGSALAKLAADQLAHARRLQASGRVRHTAQFLALHSPKGNVDRLLAAAGACTRHLKDARIGAELVTDWRLAAALSADWHPGAREPAYLPCEFPVGTGDLLGVIDYAPGRAEVVDPKSLTPPPSAPAPKARVREAPPATNGRALPR